MRLLLITCFSASLLSSNSGRVSAFSPVSLDSESCSNTQSYYSKTLLGSNRRDFLSKATTFVATTSAGLVLAGGQPAVGASPEIFTLSNGIKYAVLKPAKGDNHPVEGDLVAIEYTGYLVDRSIFDATHAEGKKNALAFTLGSTAVIKGINEMVKEMGVGEKVQAIIPPELAFGDKGVCIETGECLVPPKATLVYDISLKIDAVPPP